MFWRRRDEHPRVDDLSAYLDGELRGRRQGEVAAHLDACEWCRVLFEELRGAKAALAGLPRVGAPRSFRLAPERAYVPGGRPPQRRSVLAYAPAVALSLFVALLAVDLATLPRDDAGAGGAALSSDAAAEKQAAEAFRGEGRSAADESAPGLAITPPATGQTRPEAAGAPLPTEMPAPNTGPGPEASAPSERAVHQLGEEGSSRLWLRLLEAAAGAAFVASVFVLTWPRIKGGVKR